MKKRLVAIPLITAGVLLVIGTGRGIHSKSLYQALQAQWLPQVQANIGTGAIEGFVHNAEGQPIGGARIYLESVGIILTGLPGTVTDQNGRFLIKNLPPGTYLIYAENEKESYAGTSSPSFNNGERPPRVEVLAGQITSGIALNLGSRAARLVGRVIDGTTKKGVKNASIVIRSADGGNHYYSTTLGVKGDFMVLVPSVPVTVEVSARGYEKWRYINPEPDEQAKGLKLKLGTTKNLTIALRPERTATRKR